jgi:hypothetical protein
MSFDLWQRLCEIHRVISHSSFNPPRRISYLNILDAIRLLRNYISHHWFSNDLFEGMLDLGIDNFVVSLTQNIFSQFSLSVELNSCGGSSVIYDKRIYHSLKSR